MNWKIVSYDDSIFSKRLAMMLGLKVCRKPEGSFDGLFFFDMCPKHIEFCRSYRNIPKICYWTGSDAVNFLENPKTKSDFGFAAHAIDSPMLVLKLSRKIPVPCFIPLPPYLQNADIKLDGAPGVLMYVTEHKARDIERSKAFIRVLPDIPICIMSGKGKPAITSKFQENITDIGWIEDGQREKLFESIFAYVRLMYYDGLSQMVVEMKTIGRHVFYTGLAPYCHLIQESDSPSKIAASVRAMLNSPLDMEGARWYREVFSIENFLGITERLCKTKGWDFDVRRN